MWCAQIFKYNHMEWVWWWWLLQCWHIVSLWTVPGHMKQSTDHYIIPMFKYRFHTMSTTVDNTARSSWDFCFLTCGDMIAMLKTGDVGKGWNVLLWNQKKQKHFCPDKTICAKKSKVLTNKIRSRNGIFVNVSGKLTIIWSGLVERSLRHARKIADVWTRF